MIKWVENKKTVSAYISEHTEGEGGLKVKKQIDKKKS